MAVTATDLNALAKEIYAPEVINAIPESMLFCKDYKFKEAASTGDKFVQPVKMSHEHGFTYSSDQTDAFDLNAAVPAIFKEAQVDGSAMVLRSVLSYVQLAKLNNSKKSFMTAPSALIEDMNQSTWKRIEIAAFYGRSAGGLGIVEAVDVTVPAAPIVTITAASFAPGIWAGSENALIDVYTADTKQNTLDVKISSASIKDRKLTLALSAGETGDVVAGDIIFWKGAKESEPIGLDKIVNNTGSLYGIDASAYSMWKSSITSSVGALSLKAILELVDDAINKGLEGDVNVYIPSKAFTALSSEQAALRKFDASYKSDKGQNGFKGLTFWHQSGELRIKPSIYVKQGDVFICPVEGGHRIGASDVTFNTPGMNEEKMFHQLESNAGVGIRCFTHQSVFFEKPAHLSKGEGVTYS